MKVLTLNFLTCAVKACKSTAACFPLHPKDAELVSEDIELNPKLLLNVMSRIDWNALKTTAGEVRPGSRSHPDRMRISIARPQDNLRSPV